MKNQRLIAKMLTGLLLTAGLGLAGVSSYTAIKYMVNKDKMDSIYGDIISSPEFIAHQQADIEQYRQEYINGNYSFDKFEEKLNELNGEQYIVDYINNNEVQGVDKDFVNSNNNLIYNQGTVSPITNAWLMAVAGLAVAGTGALIHKETVQDDKEYKEALNK